MDIAASNLAPSPRFRKARIGPETEMIHSALAAGLPFKWSGEAITFQELELPSGAPDIVLLRMNHLEDSSRTILSEHELKLLHFLFSNQNTSLPAACGLLCWNPRLGERIASSLGEQRLMTTKKNGQLAVSENARKLLAREIIAIEAKIGEWKRALAQAQQNRWFASESYILLKGKIPPAAIEAATETGIGILSYNEGRTRFVVKSEKTKLPGSYASWLISTWAHQEAHA